MVVVEPSWVPSTTDLLESHGARLGPVIKIQGSPESARASLASHISHLMDLVDPDAEYDTTTITASGTTQHGPQSLQLHCLCAIVRSATHVLTVDALQYVPESIVITLFEACYQTGRLTPRIVETFLALDLADVASLVAERHIEMVDGKPWTPPLNTRDGYKRRHPF